MSTTPDLPHLATLCLAHLEREESLLVEMLASLNEINEALRHGGMRQLEMQKAKQAQLTIRCEQIQHNRRSICTILAEALQLDGQEVTLTTVAEKLRSPWKEQLLALRNRMQELVGRIDKLNKQNHSLISYTRRYVQKLLGEGSEESITSQRYDLRGKQLAALMGGFVQVKG